MTELKKLTKIWLVAYTIVTLLYGIMYLTIPELLIGAVGWYDPMDPRVFGGICLICSIYAIIILRRKEWESVKLIYSYLFVIFIPTIIINISLLILLFPTLSAFALSQFFMGLIFMSILFVLGVSSYIKQK
ncbi:MAG: hypothetical protein ACFE9Q_17540 [Candidatus Hodarchaeota archaeon]